MKELSAGRERKLIGLVTAAAAGVLMRWLIKGVWRAAREAEPPVNPRRQDASWTGAVIFALGTGLAVGLARLGGRVLADRARS